mmetsp:Transcript_30068/g.64039  ORF Transcript_30068/g.64039 Transcript_30068/m.64039 type:complete len:106 (+) Transcript_30068:53-370(+)
MQVSSWVEEALQKFVNNRRASLLTNPGATGPQLLCNRKGEVRRSDIAASTNRSVEIQKGRSRHIEPQWARCHTLISDKTISEPTAPPQTPGSAQPADSHMHGAPP